MIWEYSLANFSEWEYSQGVHKLFNTYEKFFSRKLVPGENHKVGLKVYTGSGPGLSTPKALVRAVIKELEARGFLREEIFILDENTYYLRACGFLPQLSAGGNTFEGVLVCALDQKVYWDSEWHYISSLPSRQAFARSFVRYDDGKSLLPVPLLLDIDFWINLPMVTSHESTGISGALTNATIFNISNNKRFTDNSIYASIAIAEIAAIPELQESWIFTLMTLEHYQFIGGSVFSSHYTRSEPILWLSTNAPAIDYLMFKKINKSRKQEQLPSFENVPDFFEYCKSLSVGNYKDSCIVRLK